MGFLAAVAAKVLTWLLEKGGRALYEWIVEFTERQKQEKANKENKKKYDEAVKSGDADKKLEAERDLLNGK